MKYLFAYLFISGFLIFSGSCKNLDPERASPVPDRKNYIRSYIIEPDSLLFYSDNPYRFELSGKIVSDVENKHMFDSISAINNDDDFNRNYGLNLNAPVLNDTIYGIEIACDSFLNYDSVYIIYNSYDEILKSGYDTTIRSKKQETLTEFNKNPKILVGIYFQMFFEDSAQVYKNKKYSVTIKLDNKELRTDCHL